MLPDIPTLLIRPNKSLQHKLVHLVSLIETSKLELSIRGAFTERYLVCHRAKIPKSDRQPKRPRKEKEEVLGKAKEEQQATRQQIYLRQVIERKISWTSLEKQLQLFQDNSRMTWHYFHYLFLEVLRRTPGKLPHFIFTCLWNKSWQSFLPLLDLVKRSIYIEHRVDYLLTKGVGTLEKIQDRFLGKVLICLFQKETHIPTILNRTNFLTLVKQKKEHFEIFMVEEWLSFLCGYFSNNTAKEVPILKLVRDKKQHTFVLRWGKIKVLSTSLKQLFQAKFDKIKANVDDIEEAFVNEIEQELIVGLIKGRSWIDVRLNIELGVKYMNEYEVRNNDKMGEKSKIFYDDEMECSQISKRFNASLSNTWDRQTQNSFLTQRGVNKRRTKSCRKQESQKSRDLSISEKLVKADDDGEFPSLVFTEQQEEMMYHLSQHEKQLNSLKANYFQGIQPQVIQQFCREHQVYLENKYKKLQPLYEIPEMMDKRVNQDIIKLRNATKCLKGNRPLFNKTAGSIKHQKQQTNAEEQSSRLDKKNKVIDQIDRIQFSYPSQTFQNNKGKAAN